MLMHTLTQAHSPDFEQSRPDIERSRDVPAPHPYNLQQAIERFERGYIANILELTRWNRRKAAQMLGIPPDMLALKMRYYQLDSSPAPSHSWECK